MVRKKDSPLIVSGLSFWFVELAGIEPASKQGNPVLSTRLFQTELSGTCKTWTTNLCLSL